MEVNKKVRLRLMLQNGVFVVLLVAAAVLLLFIAREHRAHWDATRSARNTLSQGSLEVLKQLPGPIVVTAYAGEQGDLREAIRNFLAPYQRAKPDFHLKFVDPRDEPKQTKEAGIKSAGELLVHYQERSQHLSPAEFNEQALANLLMRLSRAKERLVMGLEGHGERKLDGIANHDLGEFGKQLSAKGFKVNSLNLASAQEVPDNADLLIVTQPGVGWLPGEMEKLARHLQKGGNLLWLVDPEPLRGLEALAENLGILLSPGVVVDPAASQLKLSVTWAISAAYGNHPATRQFDLITVYPLARSIGFEENKAWRVAPLVEVAQNGWVETGALEKQVTLDRQADTPGPVTIAVALTRTAGDREQRIVVVGSGEFLSNAYIGNAGNLDFGINLVNWLAGDENLVTVQPQASVDSRLELATGPALGITITFLVALPLVFLVTGGVIWWRRRRA
jgi:ABC-type uncharacterized transport system involved in gliding motility auxiliary subunit